MAETVPPTPALAHLGAAADLCKRGLEPWTKHRARSGPGGAHGREGRQLQFVVGGTWALFMFLNEQSDLLEVTPSRRVSWLITGRGLYLPCLMEP